MLNWWFTVDMRLCSWRVQRVAQPTEEHVTIKMTPNSPKTGVIMLSHDNKMHLRGFIFQHKSLSRPDSFRKNSICIFLLSGRDLWLAENRGISLAATVRACDSSAALTGHNFVIVVSRDHFSKLSWGLAHLRHHYREICLLRIKPSKQAVCNVIWCQSVREHTTGKDLRAVPQFN